MTAAALEAFYACALRLYPAVFRKAYGDPMLRSFRDALADNSIPRRTLIPLVVRDLLTSLIKEHFAMLRETYSRPALVFNALILVGISTVLSLALYAIPQQVLRNGANDPQIELATNLGARLDSYGVTAGLTQGALGNGGGTVDMERSLSPFLIVYDDQGRALGSNAQFDGQTPVPPKGVFDYVRAHGEERVTWQPIPNSHAVRIAAVVVRVNNGTQPGFVLAGRNMREVEAREAQVRQMAALTWIGMLGLILIGTLAFGWLTRGKPAPAIV